MLAYVCQRHIICYIFQLSNCAYWVLQKENRHFCTLYSTFTSILLVCGVEPLPSRTSLCAELMQQSAVGGWRRAAWPGSSWVSRGVSEEDDCERERFSVQAGHKSPGSGFHGVDEDRWVHVWLNMHRITGKAGGDSLIEMSPTESFNGK